MNAFTTRTTNVLLAPCLLLLATGVPHAAAAAPQITNLSSRGLQIGATTTLVVDGTDLLPSPRLLLALPIAGQTVKDGSTPNRLEIDVTLPEAVSAGIYSLRVANPQGISNAVLVGVDDLAQVPLAPQIGKLPAALTGSLAGSATVQTTFAGKKGQRLVVEVEARRLGSSLDPFVALLDPRKVQLAWSQGLAHLTGDARLEATLPADGTYTVELHDALYRGAEPGFFRLKVGELHYADLVFPLALQRQSKPALVGIGNLPAGFRIPAEAESATGEVPVSLPRLPGLTGAGPRLLITDFPAVVETDPPAGKLQEVTVPAVISGRISKPDEEDHYRLLVKPGMSLRFDVAANRVGSPLDGVLVLRNEAGAQLAASDDRPDTVDPGFDFTIGANVNAVVVALKDLHGRGGPNFVYRLAVTPTGRPDFSLTIFEERQQVPQAGSAVFRVRATRSSYGGAIKLSFPGLPPGVLVTGDEIAAGATDALVSLTAPTGMSLTQMVTQLVGEITTPEGPVRRPALRPETPAARHQPWLRSELALAVTAAGPLGITWAPGDTPLPLGYGSPAQVQVQRAQGVAGPVRLSLLSSQIAPKTKDGKQDDVNRTLRLQGTPMITADQQAGQATILVPADLPALPYDLALRAELLSADGKNVLATAVTPSRRLRPTPPFALQLAGSAAVEARSGIGPTGKLLGKVTRVGDFNKPLRVTLSGLPAGVPAPAVVVPPGKSDFELPVSLPYGLKPGPLADVKLVATDPGPPIVRSNAIALTVNVVPGEPPAPPPVTPPPVLVVFEDQAEFVAALRDGAGTASLEAGDKFSGTHSIKVTPEQRFAPFLPGLGVKIRENPGPGEYRFLRFAWKKRGGQTICLQLNHDGAWGPTSGKPAKFRYHAGPGQEPFGASVLVQPNLPGEWTVVTRDLFADFGAFTWTGIALSALNGEAAFFDHIRLGRTAQDLELAKPPASR